MIQLTGSPIQETQEIANHIKQMALSGDMSAAKLYLEFALNTSQQRAEQAVDMVSELTDDQTKKIVALLQEDVSQ
jgi:predicted Zn-dependent protease